MRHAGLSVVAIGAKPACPLNLPNASWRLGLELHVQGGAFEATLDPLGIGVGTTIRGVVGDA